MTEHETCGRCDGSGQIACQACRGTGIVKQPGSYGGQEACSSCKGTGVARCHACGGSGTVKLDS